MIKILTSVSNKELRSKLQDKVIYILYATFLFSYPGRQM